MKKNILLLLSFLCISIFLIGCTKQLPPKTQIERLSAIPTDITKGTMTNDPHPPILHSTNYKNPIPLPEPISTIGAEDSPFIPYSSNDFYFFFAPDVRVPVEKQVLDPTVGIWKSTKNTTDNTWSQPEKVILNSDLALDGCGYVRDNEIIFCSARGGYTGVNWFRAELNDDKWKNWEYAGDSLMQDEYEVGELHIWQNELYYHSAYEGGKGQNDIWMMTKDNDKWINPINVSAVNSAEADGYPYISPDGQEMWFTRTYRGTPAIFMSQRINNEWQTPKLIVSQFAGEPTLDMDGNLYFVHHYFINGEMIEADIYVAEKK